MDINNLRARKANIFGKDEGMEELEEKKEGREGRVKARC